MTFDNGIKCESPETLGAVMRLESRVFLCANSIGFQRTLFQVCPINAGNTGVAYKP